MNLLNRKGIRLLLNLMEEEYDDAEIDRIIRFIEVGVEHYILTSCRAEKIIELIKSERK